MNRKAYRPSPAGHVEAHPEGKRWTLVFARELPHPPRRVWSGLTDPGELREWAPFDTDRDLGTLGAATLTMAGGDGSETHSRRLEQGFGYDAACPSIPPPSSPSLGRPRGWWAHCSAWGGACSWSHSSPWPSESPSGPPSPPA